MLLCLLDSKTLSFSALGSEWPWLHAAEAGKVTAERALHELQLDMRSQVEKYNQLQEARRYASA